VAAALRPIEIDTVIVQSDLLGPIDVPDVEILRFERGLLGLPECQRFVLVPTERDGVYWLQSCEHSALVFLLLDPFKTTVGYAVDLGPEDLAELAAREPADVAVLAIVTLPRDEAEQPTANLQGPIALNLRAQRGKQVVVQDSTFGVRVPVDLR